MCLKNNYTICTPDIVHCFKYVVSCNKVKKKKKLSSHEGNRVTFVLTALVFSVHIPRKSKIHGTIEKVKQFMSGLP